MLGLMPFNAVAFSVVELLPDPNYPLTKDAFDAEQLSDGKIMKYPIWLHKEAVGWNDRSPVNIKIELNDDEIAKSSKISLLKIHTAVGEYAGVKNIKRIDVYSSIRMDSGYAHVGSYLPDKKHLNMKRQSYFIDIGVVKLNKYVSIVIHVDMGGIFIDEIELLPCDVDYCSTQTKLSGIPVGTQNEVNHSRLLFKESIKSSVIGERKLKIQSNDLINKEHIIWHTDCYKKLDWLPLDYDYAINEKINFNGYSGENADICIGIANLTTNEMSIKWNGSELIKKGASVFEVKESFIRSGEYVYDYMQPVLSKDVIIQPLSTTYLWYQLPLKAVTMNKSPDWVSISDTTDKVLKSFSISLGSYSCEDISDPMDLNVWSYSVNKPVWSNKEETVKHLYASGVNYFTVHPKLVPKLGFKGWNIKKGVRFSDEINLYRGKGTILIIPGWSPGKVGFSDGEMSTENISKITKWINEFVTIMQQNGLKYSDWALYVIDEPHGKKLDFLKFMAPLINKVNKNIRIYANPDYSRKQGASVRDLQYLNEYIDLWQPSWDFYIKTGGRFFDGLNKKWMIYRNPEYPAKAAEPEFDYRYMAWRADVASATGIGVWSYDDTQGSSAIDDFDGIRSDWSMMYESENNIPSPSRRWMALLKGIDDVRLISSYLHESDKKKLRAQIMSGTIDNNAVEKNRVKALNACQ